MGCGAAPRPARPYTFGEPVCGPTARACRYRASNIEHRTLNIQHRRKERSTRLRSMFDVECSMFDVRGSRKPRNLLLDKQLTRQTRPSRAMRARVYRKFTGEGQNGLFFLFFLSRDLDIKGPLGVKCTVVSKSGVRLLDLRRRRRPGRSWTLGWFNT